MRPALVAAGLLLISACGSTVQVSSRVADEGALQPAAPADTATVPRGSAPVQPSAVSRAPGGARTGQPATTVPSRGAAQVTGPEQVGLPGVTRTTMTVGVIAADPSADQTLEGAGFGAASLGNEPASWRAMADEVNARGGIAGRRLSLVFHLVNLTDPPAAQGQAACERFTQDTPVAAVVSGYYYESAHTCLSQKGVPAILGTNFGVDRQAAREAGSVVAWATPLLDRLAARLPDAFQGRGALRRGTKAGIFVTDAPAFTRSAAVLASELARRGIAVTTQTVRDSSSGDYTSATSDASAAVLRFRTADVSEVLFLTRNAFEPTLLMQAAASQGYQPRYLLSTQQYPATLVGLVPRGQLERAVAVGWAPVIDLSSGYATGARAKECLATLTKRGRSYSSGTQTAVGLLACDGLELLKRAAESPGGLTAPDALRRAALAAHGFVSAVTLGTRFVGGRPDGVDAYRLMDFDAGCNCFRYVGAARTL